MAEDLPEMPLTADLAARIDSLPDLVNGDEALIRRGRFLTVEMLIELGRVPYYVAIERGRIASLARGPAALRPWRFALRAGEAAWRRFWQPEPEPHYHDLFAMAKLGEMRIEGDLAPFMANLLYLKEVLAAPRRAAPERRS